MPDVPYILGHSPAELRRLMLQSTIPITERITPGLREFDLGCSDAKPPIKSGQVGMRSLSAWEYAPSQISVETDACRIKLGRSSTPR